MTMTEQRPTTNTRRYPLAPLIAITHAQDLHQLARQLGLTHRHLRRMQAQGLQDREADRYAIRLGHHPSHIWPNWHDIDPDIEEDDHGIMRPRPAAS